MSHVRPIWILVAIASIGAISAQAAVGGPVTPPSTSPRLTNPVASVTLDSLAQTRDRPLFTASRHAAVKVQVVSRAEPPPPPPEPPKLSLYGVVVDGKGPRAVLRLDSTGKMMHAHLGDEIGGWRVSRIEQRRLVIALDDRLVAVTMFAGPNAGSGPTVHVAKMHRQDRIFEVNAAGVLRSHRIHRNQ